jgi:hypothetical protein
MHKQSIEDMPVFFVFPESKKQFNSDELQDVREARAIIRNKKPITVWRCQDENLKKSVQSF